MTGRRDPFTAMPTRTLGTGGYVRRVTTPHRQREAFMRELARLPRAEQRRRLLAVAEAA